MCLQMPKKKLSYRDCSFNVSFDIPDPSYFANGYTYPYLYQGEKYTFTDYAPKTFHNIRKLFNITEHEYAVCFLN